MRVASLSKQPVQPVLDQVVAYCMFTGQETDADLPLIRNWAAALDDDLMARSEREMQAGARVVFWGESNALVLKQDEATFIASGSALAAKYYAYLGMGLGVSDPTHTRPNEVHRAAIGPDGKVAWGILQEPSRARRRGPNASPGTGKLKFSDNALLTPDRGHLFRWGFPSSGLRRQRAGGQVSNPAAIGRQ